MTKKLPKHADCKKPTKAAKKKVAPAVRQSERLAIDYGFVASAKLSDRVE